MQWEFRWSLVITVTSARSSREEYLHVVRAEAGSKILSNGVRDSRSFFKQLAHNSNKAIVSYVTSTQSPTGLNSLGIPILCNDLLRNTQFCMAPHKKLCTDTGRRDTNRDQKNRNGDDAAKPRRDNNIQIGKNRGSNNNPVKP